MKIYVDGSAHPNPGPGGFGVVVVDDDDKLLFCHSKQADYTTTNNEQELLGVLYAAMRYGRLNPTPEVYCDSAYAVNTFNDWMFGWEKNDWKKSDKRTPENIDIIKLYFNMHAQGFRIDLKKVPGHSGVKWNELADKLARGLITPKEAIEKEQYGKQ